MAINLRQVMPSNQKFIIIKHTILSELCAFVSGGFEPRKGREWYYFVTSKSWERKLMQGIKVLISKQVSTL